MRCVLFVHYEECRCTHEVSAPSKNGYLGMILKGSRQNAMEYAVVRHYRDIKKRKSGFLYCLMWVRSFIGKEG